MADNQPHAVVRLLLARMSSHPEEFRVGKEPFHNRWEDHLTSIDIFGNETDKAAVNAAMRDIRLAEIHEQVMDELLNGPERRRAEMEEAKAAKNQSIAHSHQAQQQLYGQFKQQQYGGIPRALKGILK
jgi:hypothetical protein